MGFFGETNKPLGKIELEIRFGDHDMYRRTMMTFCVVRSPSPYNVILGRTGLKELRAIPSTKHSMIKFPTPRGVSSLMTRPSIVSECRRLKEKQMVKETKSDAPQEAEVVGEGVADTEEILVNPAYPEQLVVIGKGFSAECRRNLIELLRKNKDVFAWQPSDVTVVPRYLIQHRLNVNIADSPVTQKKQNFSAEKNQVISKEVEEWLKAGIVRPVRYPTWISNPVLVKKCDGSWRMCIDFKNLNSSCPKDYYPLPEIDWKIESVVGFQYKCFLDAYKGYYQVQMAEEDEEKTTFYSEQGTYCYIKMPFGLKNVRATHQQLVDSAFQSQIGRNLEAYVDDMMIKSKDEREMLADISETFHNLRQINMKLNPKKCSFGVEEGKFLGYIVTSEGIRANLKKTTAIAEMKSPSTLKEMQSMKGKLAALNHFLAMSAEKSLPFFETLKNITKENKEEYRWTDEAERAFQSLKQLILSLPSLATPKIKEVLYVYLAAAKSAISDVLLTKRDGRPLPIHYVSRTLQEVKRSYSPIEKLVLSLLDSSRRLRRYFEAHPIKVITDQPIKQILNKAEASGTLTKYAEWTYIPRNVVKGQVLADFISEILVGINEGAKKEICDISALEE